MNRKLIISRLAQNKLESIFDYLLENWGKKAKQDFIKKLDKSVAAIEKNPSGFPQSAERPGIHKCVISKQSTMYYRFSSEVIVVLTVFDNRQAPNKLDKEI